MFPEVYEKDGIKVIFGGRELLNIYGTNKKVPTFEPYVTIGKIGITDDFKIICMKTARILYQFEQKVKITPVRLTSCDGKKNLFVEFNEQIAIITA